MAKHIIIGLFPVLIGGLIYLTYRTETLLMFGWFNYIGFSDVIEFLRLNPLLQNIAIPNWIKYSLPDALWLFSFNYILLIFWNFRIDIHSVFWFFLSASIGVFSELGQLINIIPGTFDYIDLLLLLIASIIPFLIVHLKSKKQNLL